METEKKIRVKKFFYGIIAFIILFNLVLTEKNKVRGDVNNYFATFNKIDGVSVGTDVVISGIKVGQVKEISVLFLLLVGFLLALLFTNSTQKIKNFNFSFVSLLITSLAFCYSLYSLKKASEFLYFNF